MNKNKWAPKAHPQQKKEQPFMNRVGKPLTGESMINFDKPTPKAQPFSKGLTK